MAIAHPESGPFSPGLGRSQAEAGWAEGPISTAPANEHNEDLNSPKGFLSRHWRRLVGVGALAGAIGLGAGIDTAVRGDHSPNRPPAAVAPGLPLPIPESAAPKRIEVKHVTPEGADPNCFGAKYVALDSSSQDKCRTEIANFTMGQVNQLTPSDRARWALYYRGTKLNMTGSDLYAFFQGYETDMANPARTAQNALDTANSVYVRLAYLEQTNPTTAYNPLTFRAIFGDNPNEQMLNVVDDIKNKYPVNSQQENFPHYNDRILGDSLTRGPSYKPLDQVLNPNFSGFNADGAGKLTWQSNTADGETVTMTVTARYSDYVEGGGEVRGYDPNSITGRPVVYDLF